MQKPEISRSDVQDIKVSDLHAHSTHAEGLHGNLDWQSEKAAYIWVEELAENFDEEKSASDPMLYMFKRINGEITGHVIAGQHRTLALMMRHHQDITISEIPEKIWRLEAPPEPIHLKLGLVFDLFTSLMKFPTMGDLFRQLQEKKRRDQAKLTIPPYLKQAYILLIVDFLKKGKKIREFIRQNSYKDLLDVLYQYQRKYVEQQIINGQKLSKNDVKFIKLAELTSHCIGIESLHGNLERGTSISTWIENLSKEFDVEKCEQDPILLSFKLVKNRLVGHVVQGQVRVIVLLKKYGVEIDLGMIPHKIWKMVPATNPLFELFMKLPKMGDLYRQTVIA